MDLALQLGDRDITDMPERDFQLWVRYANRRMLPWRRVELYLGRIALLIAQTMGGAKDAVLADYLFDPEEEIEIDSRNAAEFFGYAPRNTKE